MKEIKQILITYLDDNLTIDNATIVYLDGTILHTKDINIISDNIKMLMKQKNVDKPSQLIETKDIVTSYKSFEDLNIVQDLEQEQTTDIKPKNIRVFMAGIMAAFAIAGVGALGYNYGVNKNKDDSLKPNAININSINDIELMIASLKEGTKKEVVSKAYKFLKESNELGGSYTFQGIVDYIVLTEKYTGAELYNLYDSYDLQMNKEHEFITKKETANKLENDKIISKATYISDFMIATDNFILNSKDRNKAILLLKGIVKDSHSLNCLDNLATFTNSKDLNSLSNMKEEIKKSFSDDNTKNIDKVFVMALPVTANLIAEKQTVFDQKFFDEYDKLNACGSLVYDMGLVMGSLDTSRNITSSSVDDLGNAQYSSILALAQDEEKERVIICEEIQEKQPEKVSLPNYSAPVDLPKTPSNVGSATSPEIKKEDIKKLPQKEQESVKKQENDLRYEERLEIAKNDGKFAGRDFSEIRDKVSTDYFMYEIIPEINDIYAEFSTEIEDKIAEEKEKLLNIDDVKYSDKAMANFMQAFKEELRKGIQFTIKEGIKDGKISLKKAENAEINSSSSSTSSSDASQPFYPENEEDIEFIGNMGDYVDKSTLTSSDSSKTR